MKTFRYKWNDEIWLLHVEANNTSRYSKSLLYSRIISNGNNGQKNKVLVKPGESFRFILSRGSVQETGLDIRFDKDLLVKIFRLQDRAYLPGDSDICYSNKVEN
ncbi:MAG: hypothetical protein KKD11_02930 [Candidatus Omnitrophica bacterium]|nr:hypothetical protein [Candidatus Omnitrophota bacterium]